MRAEADDLDQLATLSAHLQLGCDGPGSCLQGEAAVAINLHNKAGSFMIGSVQAATINDVLDVFAKGQIDASTAAVAAMIDSVNLTQHIRLPRVCPPQLSVLWGGRFGVSSAAVKVLGCCEVAEGLSLSSAGFVLGGLPVQIRAVIRPVSAEYSTAAFRAEMRLTNPLLLAKWIRFTGTGATLVAAAGVSSAQALRVQLDRLSVSAQCLAPLH